LIYKCGGIDQRTIEKFEKVIRAFHTFITPTLTPIIGSRRAR
jgi:hypothetical protein